jgi:preprotein translocase subunit YajC
MAHFFSLFPLLQASAGAAASSGATSTANPTMGIIMQIAPIVLLLVVFYFILIRPQSKKQKETEKMLSSIKKGDKVVTIGGLYGTVTSVREKTVVLKVDENTKMEFLRSAISSIESREDKEVEDKSEKTETADKAETPSDKK